MARVPSAMASSIARKNLMALTGLLLCCFLLVHVLGNLPLLLPGAQGQEAFNQYAELLSGLAVVKIAGIVTLSGMVIHALLALALTWRARGSSNGAVVKSPSRPTSTWSSRFAWATGLTLAVFLVVHLWNFWWPYKFGGDSVPNDVWGRRDLYGLVQSTLSNPVYAAFYGLSMLALAAHLRHGVVSALRSLGLHPPGLTRAANVAGSIFTAFVACAFIAMIVMVFLTQR